jgi:hypothetical protein
MQNINLENIKTYPVYRLVEGGERIIVELNPDKFKSLKPHHIGPEGILCDDLETFIKWEMFSK